MSLVGTRPPTVDEWEQYELHHRSRMSTKPGTIAESLKERYTTAFRRRERVWKVLRPYRMKLLRLAPAKFIHFGTTREILELMSGGVDEYRELGWSRLIGSSIKDSDTAGYNSVLSSRADISKDC